MEKIWDRLADFTIKKAKNRYKAGIYEGVISCIVNFFLFIVKVIIGFYLKSISLITDAFHSLSDCLSSIMLIIGFYYSSKPADEEHPFGHAKVENISSLIVAIMLFIISFEFAKDSLIRIFRPEKIIFSFPCLVVVFLTLILKEFLSKYSEFLGKKLNSVAIEADAHHHKTDVYATLLVIISLILSKFGIQRVDGVIGLVISIYIGLIAYKMAKKSINPLLGEKPSEDLLNEIKKIAFSVEGVKGVHDIIIHNYGDKHIVSLHIEVPDELNPNEIHDIADEVEKKISGFCNAMCVVHQDPINTDHPYYDKIKSFLDELLDDKYHDLKIIGTEKKFNVIFDVNIKTNDPKEKLKFVSEIKEKLKENFSEIDDVIIKIEPEYVY